VKVKKIDLREFLGIGTVRVRDGNTWATGAEKKVNSIHRAQGGNPARRKPAQFKDLDGE
jgi:hypothetical protein